MSLKQTISNLVYKLDRESSQTPETKRCIEEEYTSHAERQPSARINRQNPESYSKPFYFGHIDLMRDTVLPKVNHRMFLERLRSRDRGAI